MLRSKMVWLGFVMGFVLMALAACDRAPPAAGDAAAPEQAAAPAAVPPPSTDAELEQLKTVAPVDACATLTPEKLKAVFPDLGFEVHQKLDPRMSGYVWDSRCSYRAGVGTIEYAKDTPTHTVEIFVATSATEDKARANLASRHETAVNATGYQAQPALGENAYTTTNTGVAMLYFVKGQSEVQINFSDLKTPNDEKVRKAVALAQSL
jgi:hypothetical protein